MAADESTTDLATATGATIPDPRPPAPADAGRSITSPLQALKLDERRRTERVVIVMYLLTLAALGSVPLLGGDPFWKRAVYVTVGSSFLAAVALGRSLRRPETSELWLTALWGVMATGVVTVSIYWGAFSPAPMVFVIGIHFVSLGQSLRLALLIYLYTALAYAVVCVLLLTSTAADPGLFSWAGAGDRAGWITAVMVQFVLAISFLLGRWSRQATLSAFTELERALRSVEQREGVLEEVREDLERVQRAGAPGRLSGEVVGSFRLGAVLGRGGMGEVYDAVRVADGTPAAVKVLHPGGDADQLTRFWREVEAVTSLDSEHVVAVFEHARAGAALPYMAMERLEGEDLARYLRSRVRLPPADVIELVTQVARGVDAAADAGIVHRDLKPQNLFRVERAHGEVLWKILDFGVSKLADSQGSLTGNRVVGTPAYMAPEQAEGDTVDRRADIYALGAIAYRALTGFPPFRGSDVAGVLYRVVHTTPPAPSKLAPDLDRRLDGVLTRAMAKRPEQRYATAGELARALAAASSALLISP